MSKKGKIRKFYKNNRIYCILMMVSFVCIMLLGASVVVYFIHQAASDSYGIRLDNLKEDEVKKDVDAITEWYKNKEGVSNANIRVQGKIIYISFEVDTNVTNEAIEAIATGSLEAVGDYSKENCDLQFIANRKDKASYFGSRAAGKTTISWAKYNLNNTTEKAA